MILLIDNYDSFSYNLYQCVGAINPDIKIVRNDEVSVEEIKNIAPEKIFISPGPGKPSDAGICIDVIKKLHADAPILGICLGHQAIYEAFGGTVSYASKLMHGKSSEIIVDNCNPLFKGLPTTIRAARYHSLAGMEPTLPSSLRVIARTAGGTGTNAQIMEIMAVCHKDYPTYGVQFHPESILTPQGKIIIENFMRL